MSRSVFAEVLNRPGQRGSDDPLAQIAQLERNARVRSRMLDHNALRAAMPFLTELQVQSIASKAGTDVLMQGEVLFSPTDIEGAQSAAPSSKKSSAKRRTSLRRNSLSSGSVAPEDEADSSPHPQSSATTRSQACQERLYIIVSGQLAVRVPNQNDEVKLGVGKCFTTPLPDQPGKDVTVSIGARADDVQDSTARAIAAAVGALCGRVADLDVREPCMRRISELWLTRVEREARGGAS